MEHLRARLHQASASTLRPLCNDASNSVPLKSMETLENGLQPHSGASLQSCCSVDADAWWKQALNPWQVSSEVQNRDISGSTRRTDDLQMFFF